RMTGKEFLNSLARGKADILQQLLGILSETNSDYCLIGGLAVNAYVEPVVSLDVDIVVAVDRIGAVAAAATAKKMKVEEFQHSVNITGPASDLRIQVRTDPLYQGFIVSATEKDVLGYKMKVASLGDVLQGKVWAYMDDTRRRSKRQKDLADIARIIEAFPELTSKIPEKVRDQLQEK
ncbi:MAG TPA: hypothetical protein VI078_04840, partial [bacterium]